MRGLDPPAGPKPLRRGEGPRIHPEMKLYSKGSMAGLILQRRASRFCPATTFRIKLPLLNQTLFLVIADRAGVQRHRAADSCGLQLDLLAGDAGVRQFAQLFEAELGHR